MNKHMKKIFLLIFLILPVLIFQPAGAQSSCDADPEGKSDAELERLLELCEEEIAEQQALLRVTQQQSANIQQGINELDQKIETSNLQIKKSQVKLEQLTHEIRSKNNRIEDLVSTMSTIRETISELLRETNEKNNQTIIETLLSSGDISEFFVDADSFEIVRNQLRVRFEELVEIQALTEEEREALAVKKDEEQGQKIVKEQERRNTENFKSERERVLSLTKNQEKTYEQIIAEKEAKKQRILSKILNIGGTEITFGEALQLIKPYESKLGVDAALVLAILTQESGINGVIGANVGRCTYNQSWNNDAGTVMSNSQKDAFLQITSELGLDPNTTPVSCPINQDGQYGGAQGPSQFMPNTWMGFRNRIANVVGVSHASPWVNEHAFVGTMLYMQDALERCQTAFTSTHDLWSCSGAKYYSGLASKGSRLIRHMNGYGATVANRALSFREDIDYLNL